MNWEKLRDPIVFARVLWPHVTFYDKQREVMRSVERNDRTVVPAGNMLGKDFVAGFIALWFFLTRSPCRVVTTSVDGAQLSAVLWGEIRRFIQTAAYPLSSEHGGPLVVNHQHIRKVLSNGEIDGFSYIIGRAAAKGEGLQGHHVARTGDGIPRALALGDEASGLDDEDFRMLSTWAHRELYIGNPWPCTNQFKWDVDGKPGTLDKGGDLPRSVGEGYYRKVIRIAAVDSPNVQYGLLQKSKGIPATDDVLVPGVKTYNEYLKNRLVWDAIQQCVSLEGRFWSGAEVMLYPKEWLEYALERHKTLPIWGRRGKAIGVDCGMGVANTAMVAADEFGLLDSFSKKTRDTSEIQGLVLEFMSKWGCEAENVLFDVGGGGKQIADYMRRDGHEVRLIGFGDGVTVPIRRGMRLFAEKVEHADQRRAYTNRRAEMYGEFRAALDPSGGGYGIPLHVAELLYPQLLPIPLLRDREGRMRMLPKHKSDPDSSEKSLTELLGHSPDEADAAVLAYHGIQHQESPKYAGALQ